MAFTLTIETDNDAFTDLGSPSLDAAAAEVVRILRETADKMENGTTIGALRDRNGNRVGTFDLTD